MRNKQAPTQVHCDGQILRETQQVKLIITLKSLRTVKNLELRLRNAALAEIEASLGSS